MRQKRAKAYKRLMHAYSVTFGFRQPYQILLDAAFCESIARSGIDVEKQLETVLQGKCKPMITQCCIQELYNLGPTGQHVVDMAKNFERRKCNHREAIPGDECLTAVVGTTNPHRYIISTQSDPLRNHLRSNVPAVPVMHVKRGVTVMEPMSEVTKDKKESMETQLLAPPPSSIPAAPIPPPTASTSKGTAPPPKKKPAGPKAPNPLSMKKKKVVAKPAPAASSSTKGKGKEAASTGEKRKRDEEAAARDGEDDGEGEDEDGPAKVHIIGGETEVVGGAGEGGASAAGRKKKRRRKRGKTAATADGEGSGAEGEGDEDGEGSD